ncbi:MAG: LysR family transcriptional regulator [Acidimicrobiales bacterium]
MELRDLRAFEAAVRTGSISRAARELTLTQPSLTERIAKLERVVGAPLLVRSNRGVTTTPTGGRLLPHARRCLEVADRALVAARSEDTQDHLHITAYASLADMAALFCLETLAHLRCAIEVDDRHTDEALRRVADGATDVSFTVDLPAPRGVSSHLFAIDPVVAVVGPSHELARAVEVSLADLTAHSVAYNSWGSGCLAFEQAMLDLPVRSHLMCPIRPASAAVHLARVGRSVAVVARSSAAADLERGSLVQLRVVDLPPWEVRVMLSHRSDRSEEKAIRLLVDTAPRPKPAAATKGA